MGDRSIPDDVRIVTYVARGMESMRGFDIFMRVAKLLCDRRKDVIFVVVGDDRVCYGGDQELTGQQSFKEWVLSRDHYDLSRFVFAGPVAPRVLAQIFALSDFAFGNRPCPVIFVSPERAARMHEQHFGLAEPHAIHQKSRTHSRHRAYLTTGSVHCPREHQPV